MRRADPIADWPEPATIALDNGIELAVHERGSGRAVVLCHGFPDLPIGWRYQLGAVADAGFRAVVPSGRGYDGSSAPDDSSAYGMTELTGDLVGLLDALDIERAVFVGHDWGGWVVWGMAVLHPERVAGVVGVCTPYIPFPSIAKHLELTDGDVERQYVAWFQQDGVAQSVMDTDVEAIVARIFRTGVPTDEVLAAAFADGRLNMNPFLDAAAFPDLGVPLAGAAVIDRYVAAFRRTGFRGGINWYRNIDRNATDHPDVGVAPLDLPALMITAEWDPALTPALAAGMHDRCRDLEIRQVDRAGHWVQQEHPEVFNSLLIDWLQRRFGSS